MAGTPRSLIIDQMELANGCAAKISAAILTEGQGAVPLSPKYLERILPTSPVTWPRQTARVSMPPNWRTRLTTRQKVLLDSTRSINRARFVGGAWKQAALVFVGEFHDYVQSLGVPDGSGQEYFDEEMPRLLKELADVLPVEEKLDAVVVVDEAQDFAPLRWEALLAC